MTQGNALQNWQHIYQLSRLNIQRCSKYTYVHVCRYSFSTVVCYRYVCLFVYTCKSARSCVYLAVLTLPSVCFPCADFCSYMYTYWINDFWFLMGCKYRADSRFALSQCETALLCNNVCHWLGASLDQPWNISFHSPKLEWLVKHVRPHTLQKGTWENQHQLRHTRDRI